LTKNFTGSSSVLKCPNFSPASRCKADPREEACRALSPAPVLTPYPTLPRRSWVSLAALADVAVALEAVAPAAQQLDVVHVRAAPSEGIRDDVIVLEVVGTAALAALAAVAGRHGDLDPLRDTSGCGAARPASRGLGRAPRAVSMRTPPPLRSRRVARRSHHQGPMPPLPPRGPKPRPPRRVPEPSGWWLPSRSATPTVP
jgi:hypothetical protein